MLLRLSKFNFRLVCQFSRLGKYGIEPQALPDIPRLELPIRQTAEEEDNISKQQYHKMVGYQKKTYPRCRYMAFEHQSKIYHIFDASRYPLGRMCSIIARQIRGKNTPLYKNNVVNQGNLCVIVNASNPMLTGRKLRYKQLRYHTGFIGRLKRISYKDLLLTKPELLYHYLVKKALPKNSLSIKYLDRIHIFRGNTHDFRFLPQFAPDENIYEYLPEINLLEQIKKGQAKIIISENPDLDQQMFGKKMPVEGLPKQPEATTRKRLILTKRQLHKQQFLYKRHLSRHKIVRVPKKKVKKDDEYDLQLITDERKAKKRPDYAELADEDFPQQDQDVLKEVWIDRNEKEKQTKKPQTTKQPPKKK